MTSRCPSTAGRQLAEQDAADGVAGQQGRAAGRGPACRPRGAAPGLPGAGHDRRARQHRAAGGLPGRDRLVQQRRRGLAVAGRRRAGRGRRRPQPALAAAGAARRAGRHGPRERSTASSPTSPPPRRASTTPAPSPRCPTTRPRPGRGAASPAPRTCPTTSSRRPARACGCPARSTSRRRTSSGSSPTCPPPPRTARAGCSPTRRAGSSRSPPRDPRTVHLAERLAGDESLDLSLRRQLRDHGRRAAAPPRRPRGAGMTTDARARRPGPSVRTRVTEHLADGTRHHEDRLATEEPLEIRLAVAGPAGAARLGDHAHAGARLRAGGGLRGERVTVSSRVDPSGGLLHRRRPRSGAGVQRRDHHRGSRHRHRRGAPARGPQSPGRRPAGSAARTASPRCSTSCTAPRWTGEVPSPAVVRELPERLREGQRLFERTGGVHAAALASADGVLEVVREDVGRHNAVDKVIGARVLAGRATGAACLVVSGRAGFELVQKAVTGRHRQPGRRRRAHQPLGRPRPRGGAHALRLHVARAGACSTPDPGPGGVGSRPLSVVEI